MFPVSYQFQRKMRPFVFQTEEKITIQGKCSIDYDGDSVEVIFDNWTHDMTTTNIAFSGSIYVKGDFVLHKGSDQLYLVGKVYEEEDEESDEEDEESDEEDEEDEEDDLFHDIDDRLVTIRGEDYPETDDDASVISAISHDDEDDDVNSVLTGKPSLSDSIGYQEEELERQLQHLFVPDKEHDEDDEDDDEEDDDKDANSVLTGKPSLSASIGWQEEEQKREKQEITF